MFIGLAHVFWEETHSFVCEYDFCDIVVFMTCFLDEFLNCVTQKCFLKSCLDKREVSRFTCLEMNQLSEFPVCSLGEFVSY